MIDALTIMTYGGMVLWSWTHEPNKSYANLIDNLIANVLIEDRTDTQREHTIGDSKLKWLFAVEAQLVFIVVFPRFLQFMQLDRFLLEVRDAFVTGVALKQCPRAKGNSRGASSMYSGVSDYSALFDDEFKQLLARFDALEKFSQAPVNKNVGYHHHQVDDDENDENDVDQQQPPSHEKDTLPPGASHEMIKNTAAGGGNKKQLIGRKGQVATVGAGSSTNSAPSSPTTAGNNNTNNNKNKGKSARTWLKDGTAATADQLEKQRRDQAELEAKSSSVSSEQIQQATEAARKKYIKIDQRTGKEASVNEKDWSEQVKERGRFSSWFRTVVGNVELDTQDLDKIIPRLKEKLISKNVAVDVADKICESLRTTLTGKKVGTFSSMENVIEEALVDSLRRILRPKREIDILRSVQESKDRQRPYTIVFCGVNGVGKSTSLSKIAFWLQQNGFSIMMAAGDTFRHGAVEQLEQHGRCLNIPVFEMGYETDPSLVTKNAMQFAKTNKIDVVLVDTAGRMQDHESRMAALARLIGDNNPDLVLFVGEALVGNNGIDQLKKFNQCLVDYATLGKAPRGIDGIVLTKFDTIDDKVGAAISMVYQLGQPIVFVGVGQTYQDLKTIQPDVVVEALMK